jgi:hypothetical protein
VKLYRYIFDRQRFTLLASMLDVQFDHLTRHLKSFLDRATAGGDAVKRGTL